jgi:hypothetical protein
MPFIDPKIWRARTISAMKAAEFKQLEDYQRRGYLTAYGQRRLRRLRRELERGLIDTPVSPNPEADHFKLE